MTKEQFSNLWDIYVPENEEGDTLIQNGVSEHLAAALENAHNNKKNLAIPFGD